MVDPEQIAIGPALRGDAAAMAQLHGASFANGWDEGAFARYIDDPSYSTLVARESGDSGAVLGFVVARRAGAEADILTLSVALQARCRGIGKTLVTRLSVALAEIGVEILFLDVGEHNHAAAALYRAIGFEHAGTRENYYDTKSGGSREAANILRLELSRP